MLRRDGGHRRRATKTTRTAFRVASVGSTASGPIQDLNSPRRNSPMKLVFMVLCAALAATLGTVHAATVLITGADRGLGLEFTRQYAARGDTVIATCRHPEHASELQAL